jgi:hypothetical protein
MLDRERWIRFDCAVSVNLRGFPQKSATLGRFLMPAALLAAKAAQGWLPCSCSTIGDQIPVQVRSLAHVRVRRGGACAVGDSALTRSKQTPAELEDGSSREQTWSNDAFANMPVTFLDAPSSSSLSKEFTIGVWTAL